MTPLTDAARDLAAQHYGWAMRIIRPMLARSMACHHDDIRSAACLGLCIAARKFRPEMGKEFCKYAYMRIIGSIVDDIRTREGRLGQGEKYALITAMRESTISGGFEDEWFGVEDNEFDKVDARDAVAAVIGRCSGSQKRALKACISTYTYREAGESIGLSESNMCIHVKNIRRDVAPTFMGYETEPAPYVLHRYKPPKAIPPTPGQCRECSADVIPGRSRCQKHHDLAYKSHLKLKQQRRVAGLCQRSGCSNKTDKSLCSYHAQINKHNRIKRKQSPEVSL